MKYRIVLKHAFNEMLSLKESYLIGKSNKPNPFILLNFVEAFLIMLNPIIPHFCQNLWQSQMLPVLEKAQNLEKQPEKDLLARGWPQVGEVDYDMNSLLNYFVDTKREIRLGLEKASTQGKKGGKGGKKGKGQPAAAEEQKAPALENCHIFVGLEFQDYKKQVLEVLTTFEFDENNKIVGKWQDTIQQTIQDKKQKGLAMKFAAFVLKEAETVGKAKALML